MGDPRKANGSAKATPTSAKPANGESTRARAHTTGSIENINSALPQRGRSKKIGKYISDQPETEEEKQMASRRVNQQMIVYLYVCIAIIGSWCMGSFGFSFTWVLGILAMTFWVWRRKTITLMEQALRDKEIVLHRRRNLRQSETAEWVNFIINRWWVFSAKAISDVVKKNLDPLLQDIKPPIVESIEVLSFSVGDKTPFVKYATVYEYANGNKRPMSFNSVVTPPDGLAQAQFYQVVVELDTALHCDDFSMIFRTRLGGKRMGMNLDIAAEQLNISGKLQLIIHMDMDRAFPHISSVTFSFAEKPEVWFSLRVLKAVQMMEIPLIKNWIHSVVMGGLTEALVDPGKVDVKFERTGPTNVPETGKSRRKAAGVLTVTVEGEYIRGSTFVEDTRYCQVRVGNQKQHTQHTQGVDEWRETLAFLVDDLKTDTLTIKCKSKFLLTLTTLTNYEIRLADYPLEHQPSAEVPLESKLSKSKFGGATIKLNITMVYSALPQIEPALENGGMPASPLGYIVPSHQPPTYDTNAGVMYVCVHNAIGLLGLDRNGFSDPYCVIYCNGKKVKTTHYVERTKNPRWDVSTEVIVADYSRTILYFILYDWDGASPSEDDFLGSAHLVMPKGEKAVIRQSLVLGYNLLNVGQVVNNKMGSVNVSVIFRPVPEVLEALSETAHPAKLHKQFSDHPTTYKPKGFINQADAEKDYQKKMKLSSKRSSAVKNLLSMGHGIIELNLYQAKDLVAADSNGFSDPYCEVKVGGERKFTTSIKKKTLSPVWDEWVTLQLPKPEETLEIIVWDRDMFFQKDFLGAVSFSLDDLKKYGVDKQSNWFELQRTVNGWIQVKFKVISEEMEENDLVKACVDETGPPPQDLPMYNTRGGSAPPDLQNSQTAQNSRPEKITETDINDNTNPPITAASETPNKKEDEELGQAPPPQYSPSLPTNQSHSTANQQNPPAQTPPAITQQNQHNTSQQQQYPPPSPADSSASESSHQRRIPRSGSDAGGIARKSSRRRKGARPSSMVLDSMLPSSSSPLSYNSATLPLPRGGNDFLNIPRPRSVSQSNSVVSLAPGERFYWVQGQLLQIKGLNPARSHVYTKLRLDNRTLSQRSKKFSHGHVISKTSTINVNTNPNFNHNFDVDHGHGVAMEALLIFDVKASHKEHLATKGYSLQDLLQGEESVTRWVKVEHGVELEVFISHGNHDTSIDPERKKLSLFGSFRSKHRHNKPKTQ